MNILMVDDRHENLVALESVLGELGQNLVRASSGMEALRRLLEEDYAVILLDVQMPGMDGFETARIIRSRERSQHTPIVFLTAINKSDSHVAQGYSVGAVDYVFKPFVPEVLRAKVSAFVELAKKTHELQEEITSRRRAEQTLDRTNALLETMSRALVDFIADANPSDTFRQLLGSILPLTDSDYGFVGEISEGAKGRPQLKLHAIVGSTDAPARGAEPPGKGEPVDFKALWERLRATGEPVIANEPSAVPGRSPAAGAEAGLQSLLGLPLYRGEELVGIVGLGNRPDGYSQPLVSYLEPFVNTCSTIIGAYRNEQRRQQAEEEVRKLNEDLERRVAIRTAELKTANRELQTEIAERKRAEEERARILELEKAARTEAEAAQQRLAFLGEASAILAGSLDYQTTLERVARLVVPYLADFCIVDVVADDGHIRRVAAAHADSGQDDLMVSLREYAPVGNASQPAARVLRSGRGELVSDVDPEWLRGAARDEEHLRLFQELAPRSYMVVPLIARGHTMGVISLGTSASGRKYTTTDLHLAEDLARRAAAAIDNARLFGELEDAGRRKDEFLAMLAHELRNPLAAISNAEYVLDEIGSPEPHVARLREIVTRQTRHLTRLVDDLLDISRITRGKIELRKEALDLVAVVRRAVETTSPLIDSRQHELTVSLPERPICLEADPTRLEQVLSNLLNNAAKYTDLGGAIHLDVQEVEEGGESWAQVSVRDSGVGIPQELLPCIFDLFTQSERSLARSEGGLGIGLALVRNLVQLHGGTIAAESDGPGHGSVFTVRLPVAPGVSLSEQCSPEPETSRTVSARRVLVVEDSVDAAETLVDMLELWGHQVEVVHDGLAGIEAAARYHPEVVLLDIGLPGMDGYEVARRLRASNGNGTNGEPVPNGERMVLVALTGYGQQDDRDRSAQAGFDIHLTKPVNPDELQRLLGRST